MNREIKFRAWVDWGFNEMINDYCFLDSDMSFMGHDRTNNNYKVISVMQFTGMQDNVGVDIYEGDIIVFAEDRFEFKYEVVFQFGCFYLKFDNRFFAIFDYKSNMLKIIGNIYQNPDLL